MMKNEQIKVYMGRKAFAAPMMDRLPLRRLFACPTTCMNLWR